MKYSELTPWTGSFGSVPPHYSSVCNRAPDAHTNVNVAILVQSVDDEGEDEADVAGVVIS